MELIVNGKKEYVLSKQILRSGTSIGANVDEAIGGQSKADFISKLAIAYKEARQTSYYTPT
ncbi:four helix bundle protein [Pseudanabaena sp. FACHB-1277]|uniref:Four helix bundle protein n=1 Tax=Pseudanabaena cinerea FACHB-1277 TaxID=2949581 RepID=A0A926Z874_9CYAN|nr:four helix bundle protein [Pseudanabaena cinerea FACHB-1277]